MKTYMKTIRMISVTEEDGVLTPLKFQLKSKDEGRITVKVDNVILRNEEKLAGNKMLIYRCQSQVNGMLRVFELKYEVSTCKWYLYKM
ncbi:MAG: hypothetical protein GYA02_12345 [Clostridiaceae bacterium]|jgi:hypothetical protein|nr:hypothetical protein [Clostridiaceae bacterium]